MICNDLTARDLVGRDAAIHPYFLQLTRAKGIAAAPIGPWLVTKDEIPDPHELDIRTWVKRRTPPVREHAGHDLRRSRDGLRLQRGAGAEPR